MTRTLRKRRGVSVLRDLWSRLVANPAYKLLSLLLALTAWLYVQSDTVVESKIRVPVEWSVPEALGTIEPLPGTVAVTLRGTRIAVRNAQGSPLHLWVDLAPLGRGTHNLELFGSGVMGLPPGVEVVDVRPASMNVTLDEQITRRVPVVAESVGETAPGFHVDGIVVDPSVIEVRGPRAVIRSLETVPIVPVDISGLAADAIMEVRFQPPRSVELAHDVMARASVRVVPELEQRVFPAVPVTVWRQPGWVPVLSLIHI